MNEMMYLTIMLILVIVFLFLGFAWSFVNQRNKLIKFEIQLNELTLLFNNIQQVAEHNRDEIESVKQQQVKQELEHNQSNKGFLSNLNTIHQQLTSLQNNVETLNTQQPEDKLYSRAFKLVALGADADEISKTCEIPLAEADMLLAIHQNKESNK